MKPIQYFSEEYLEQVKAASSSEIAEFLESVRLLHEASKQTNSSTPISLKVQDELLKAFRLKCEIEGIRYQTKIKQLMSAWLSAHLPQLRCR